MPTSMYFFYEITDQQSVVMVRSIDCEWPLLPLKTVGKNVKQACEHHCEHRARDKLRCREPAVNFLFQNFFFSSFSTRLFIDILSIKTVVTTCQRLLLLHEIKFSETDLIIMLQ